MLYISLHQNTKKAYSVLSNLKFSEIKEIEIPSIVGSEDNLFRDKSILGVTLDIGKKKAYKIQRIGG